MRIETAVSESQFEEVRSLYLSAFPGNERMPFTMMIGKDRPNQEVLLFRQGQELFGFASLFHGPEGLVFLSYFAVDEKRRSQGYGTEMLQMMIERYPEKRIFLDIEAADPSAENSGERLNRKQFYLKRGFFDTGLRYEFNQVKYELLCTKPQLSAAEFDAVIRLYWSEAAADRTLIYQR